MGDRLEKAGEWNPWPAVFQESHRGERSARAKRGLLGLFFGGG